MSHRHGSNTLATAARCAFVALALLAIRAEARTIEFAGRTWEVRSGSGGPGPNRWSNAEESVWVDGAGRLHLKIRKSGDAWFSSEVYTQEPLGYGSYRFQLASNAELYDPNVVVGLFTYLDDANEIDIELARWADAGAPEGNYTVQPYFIPGNSVSFELGLESNASTHLFEWRPESIFFQSLYGYPVNPPSPSAVIRDWTYTGGSIPLAGAERLHLNFWLFQGVPPINQADAELIVKNVIFTPAALVPAPWIAYGVTYGQAAGGGLQSLHASDDQYLQVASLPDGSGSGHRTITVFEAASVATALDRLDLTIDASTDSSAVTATLELYDFDASRYVSVGSMPLSGADLRRKIEVANPGAYVRDADGHVRVRIKSLSTAAHRVRLDALRADGAN